MGQREALIKEPNNPDTIHAKLDHGQRVLELNGFGCNWIRGGMDYRSVGRAI